MVKVKGAIFTFLFLGLVYKLCCVYFHCCVFSRIERVLQEDSKRQIKLAVDRVVSHESSQVVEPLSRHKSAQLDGWQQQTVDLRTHMRSNDKIHLSIWKDQSICHLCLQNVVRSCSWRLQKTEDPPFFGPTMKFLESFRISKYHRYRFKSCQWWEIGFQNPFLGTF